MKRYKAAQEAWKIAKANPDPAATEAAQNELNALILFKSDIGAFVRLYTFLSQISIKATRTLRSGRSSISVFSHCWSSGASVRVSTCRR